MKNENIVAEIKKLTSGYNTFLLASYFSSLTTFPDSHSNYFRIESLINILLSIKSGTKKPSAQIMKKIFEVVNNSYLAYSEDPAEDVFSTLVYHAKSNYLIFEGLWEGSTFFLQRFLNILDKMPREGVFLDINQKVNALLTVSNCIANKSKLAKYTLGSPIPHKTITLSITEKAITCVDRIRFSENDLKEYGLSIENLKPFILEASEIEKLANYKHGFTPLERYPIIKKGTIYYVMLPAAISVAIRRFIIEEIDSIGMLEKLEINLALEYENHFKNIQLLGSLIGAPLHFLKEKNNSFFKAEFSAQIDEGRYIHFLMLLDNFVDNENDWFMGSNSNKKEIGIAINKSISETNTFISKEENFKDLITIIISCGWGRSLSFDLDIQEKSNWSIEMFGAHDFTVIAQTDNFTPLTLWRLKYAENKLSETGTQLINYNGFLNLYAWSLELDGHLVPHEQLSDKAPNVIIIDPTSLIDLRYKSYISVDEHIELNPWQSPVLIRKKFAKAYFPEDKKIPLYISINDAMNKKLCAFYKGAFLELWCILLLDANSDRDLQYRLWDSAILWLHKIVPTVEHFLKTLSGKRVVWSLDFSSLKVPELNDKIIDLNLAEPDEIYKYFEIICQNNNLILVKFFENFIHVFRGVDNSGEKSIIFSLLSGLNSLYKLQLSDQELHSILNIIVDSSYAKNFHLFTANTFLDIITDQIPDPIVIDQLDDSTLRIGLGWLARDKNLDPNIIGIEHCTIFLSQLVESISREMVSLLKSLNRVELISSLLLNLQAINKDQNWWSITLKAVFSQHFNKEEVATIINTKFGKFNAASLGSRIAIEMAICECPLEGGVKPGEIEISRLLAFSSLMYHLGGWSDAIYYQVMKPHVKLSSLGQIMADQTFEDEIVSKYGATIQDKILNYKMDMYDRLFESNEPIKSVETKLDSSFLKAWQSEYGVTVDQCRVLMEFFEYLAIEANVPVLIVPKSKILKPYDNNIEFSKINIESFIKSFELWPRENWNSTPDNFSKQDWYPWLFRRKLSVVTRPLIRLNNGPDPLYAIAPHVVREGILYVLHNSYDAIFDDKHFNSPEMKKWIGAKRNKEGHHFNKVISEKLNSYGWLTQKELKLTQILNKKLDKDYGDIDVLAYDLQTKRVLAIECKDLQFAKTHGEIAKQLYEFRGSINNKGGPDRLKRHLDRIKVLEENIAIVGKFLKIDKIQSIECHLIFSQVVPSVFSEYSLDKSILISDVNSLDNI